MKHLLAFALIVLTSLGSAFGQTTATIHEGIVLDEQGKPFTGTATVQHTTDGVVQKQTITAIQGTLNGPVTFYNAEGFVEEVGNYVNGNKDGMWVQYSKNGKRLGEAYYANGKKDGIWTVWDESGIKRYHMVYSMGKKIDTWKMWDENAVLVSERLYNE